MQVLPLGGKPHQRSKLAAAPRLSAFLDQRCSLNPTVEPLDGSQQHRRLLLVGVTLSRLRLTSLFRPSLQFRTTRPYVAPDPDRRYLAICHQLVRAAASDPQYLSDLRHTCATLLLSKNVHPKVVSEMLGHSSTSVTLDVYSHLLPDMQEKAAEVYAPNPQAPGPGTAAAQFPAAGSGVETAPPFLSRPAGTPAAGAAPGVLYHPAETHF